MATPALIRSKEDEPVNYSRAMTLYNKRKAEGLDPILMYDCSGLISRYLQNNGLVEKKRNCNHLADMCGTVTGRNDAAMEAGDLLFRWSSTSKYYHVGVYMGDGTVIESKGRDDGVVQRAINASGASYWNRWGRLKCLEVEDVPKVLEITKPLMQGEDIKTFQTLRNGWGYPCGTADGILGEKTMKGLLAFCATHIGAVEPVELPDKITVSVTVGGKEYKGVIGV